MRFIHHRSEISPNIIISHRNVNINTSRRQARTKQLVIVKVLHRQCIKKKPHEHFAQHDNFHCIKKWEYAVNLYFFTVNL